MNTKGELAEKVLPKGTSFDFALPQPWVDAVLELGIDPRSSYVWLYDDATPIFGRPFNLFGEYPDQSKVDFDNR